MADMIATGRTLARDIVPTVERAVPGVEVLAVELLSPSRFCVYVDHAEGVDHASVRAGDRDPRRLPRVVHDRRLVARLSTGRSAARSTSRGDRPRCPDPTADEIAGKNSFAASFVAVSERSLRIAEGEKELDIPYETIVRGNLIDEG